MHAEVADAEAVRLAASAHAHKGQVSGQAEFVDSKVTTVVARGAAMAMGGGANAGKGAANGASMAMMGCTIANATTGAARGAAMAMGGGANAGKGAANGAAMAMMGGTLAEVGAVVVAEAAGENDAKGAFVVLEEGKMTGEVVKEKLGSGGSCFGAEGVKILSAGGGATVLVVEASCSGLEGSAEGAIIPTTVEDESG